MQCKVFNCDGIASYPFSACSMNHGVLLKEATVAANDYKNNLLPFDNWYAGRGLKSWTVEEAIYYFSLV